MPEFLTGAAAQEVSTANLVAVFRDLPMNFAPGTKFEYNNSGYVLLGAVVEQVTGQPWHVALAEKLTGPLGLKSIRYGAYEGQVPEMAVGYSGAGLANTLHMSVPHAAGALIGNLRDLAAWNAALHGGKLLPPALYAQMVAPSKLADGSSVPYGFGLQQGDVRGRPAISHGGGIFGFSTDALYLPDARLFVAVYANSDTPVVPPAMVARKLAAMAIGRPYARHIEQPVDTAAVERLFFDRDRNLYTQRSGSPVTRVYPAGKGVYFYGPDSLTWFTVERAPDGRMTMAMHQNGADVAETTTRTGPVPPPPAVVQVAASVLKSYVGAYTSPIAPVEVALGNGDALSLRMGQQSTVVLRAVSATAVEAEGVAARIVFATDAAGVSGLTIHQGGLKAVFQRVR